MKALAPVRPCRCERLGQTQPGCPIHDASLRCVIPSCEFMWEHAEDEHFSPCGCYYFNCGQFELCAFHEAEEEARWAAESAKP